MTPVEPITLDRLASRLAVRLVDLATGERTRVIVDGPLWAGVDLVSPLAVALRECGREPIVVEAADFLRPASLRLEHGRDDPDAFYDDWIDIDGLVREVLVPLGPGGSGRYLTSLWDAQRDRATRASYRAASTDAVLLLRGWLLLGRGLPAELAVHLALSPAARRRRVPAPDAARELPAFDRYEMQVKPAALAAVVVRCDDPRHVAVVGLSPPRGTR